MKKKIETYSQISLQHKMSESNVVWKDIAGFDKYEISNTGLVKNKRTLRCVKPVFDGKYWRVSLCDGSKNTNGSFKFTKRSLHRLIANTFITNSDEKRKYIDHIDGLTDNYQIENLRWCTAGENKRSSYEIRGCNAVLQLDLSGRLIKRWDSARQIVEANPTFTVYHIGNVIHGRVKTHRGYKWAYEKVTVKKPVRDLYPDEIFENIGEFDGHDFSKYFVSNYGLVKNSRDMVLKPFDDRGYNAYTLYDDNNGKPHQMMAHRLVAYKFCPNRSSERNTVNHRDETRKNNYYQNLEWVTDRQNSQHSRAKQVQQIDVETDRVIATFASMTLAGENLGKTTGSISECCSGKKKTAYGFKWRLL